MRARHALPFEKAQVNVNVVDGLNFFYICFRV